MDYLQLFELVEERFDGPPIGRMNIYLAELLADIGASGEVVSPRLAQQALKTVKRSAALRGAHAVDRVDFVDLRFVPGMAQSARNIEADLNHLIEREAAREHILAAEARYEEFVRQMSRLRQRRDAHGMLDIGAELHRFIDEVASLRVTDDFAARRRDLRNNVEAIANEAQRLTVEYSTGAAPRVNY
jgi:hypothetical protein